MTRGLCALALVLSLGACGEPVRVFTRDASLSPRDVASTDAARVDAVHHHAQRIDEAAAAEDDVIVMRVVLVVVAQVDMTAGLAQRLLAVEEPRGGDQPPLDR